MGRMPYLAYLWPGLPMILASGSWFGLGWAVGFSLLINLLIVASVWWPELLISHVRTVVWVATAVFWCGATFFSYKVVRDMELVEDAPVGPTFADATNHYLRADWFGAEQVLQELLDKNPRDVDSGLMLATLWRHTGRIAEASQQLDRLELLDGSRKWMLEIYHERKRLEDASKEEETAVDVGRAA